MAMCDVILRDSIHGESYRGEVLAVAVTEAASEKELLRQAELHQVKWSTPEYRPGILIWGPRLISVGEVKFFLKEVPLAD